MDEEASKLYSRQLRFAPFGRAGHERWRRTRVALVGLGGLGSHAAELLVRSGVGALRLVDRDVVEWSNLPRQGLYRAQDARSGRAKAEAAAERLAELGLETVLEARAKDFTAATALPLLEGVDLVIDGLDNFEGRYLLSDACRRAGLPWVYGGAVAERGAVASFRPGDRPCLRCLFPEEEGLALEETCDVAGVFSPLPALVAAQQVGEAMRAVTDAPNDFRLWQFEAFRGHARVFRPRIVPGSCAACDHGELPALERPADSAAKLCGRDTVQLHPPVERTLDLARLAERWQGLGEVQRTPFLVRLAIDGLRLSVFADGRALVQGCDDLATARGLYARYVGS